MKTLPTLILLGSLALAPAACKSDDDKRGTSAKAVENSEKEAMAQKDDVADKREDVAEAQKNLAEEKAGLREETAEFTRARDEFVAKARTRMSALDKRIDAIKADYTAGSARLKGDARKDTAELIQKLDTLRAQAGTAFETAATGTKERWSELEKNTGETLNDIEKTADDAVDKLKDAGVKLRAEATTKLD